MQMGITGLGRMGANIARRLHRDGHRIVVHNRSPGPVDELAAEGLTGSHTLDELVAALEPPRAVWVMVPAGAITEMVIADLAARLDPGDTIIDGGNTYYRDDIRRAGELAGKGIHYLDIGTSGGVWGLERGYCLMIGGEGPVVDRLAPIFRSLAPGVEAAPRTPGRSGAERSADAETAPLDHPEFYQYDIDTAAVTELWRRGSVIGSWLLDLTATALLESPDLDGFSGRVSDSGEGRWTSIAAVEEGVPAPVLTAALYSRFSSRDLSEYADKALSAMRKQFGGHAEKPPGSS
jgi:6-phosphogluconate dehydrogenase